jgi:hypothetical protein
MLRNLGLVGHKWLKLNLRAADDRRGKKWLLGLVQLQKNQYLDYVLRAVEGAGNALRAVTSPHKLINILYVVFGKICSRGYHNIENKTSYMHSIELSKIYSPNMHVKQIIHQTFISILNALHHVIEAFHPSQQKAD